MARWYCCSILSQTHLMHRSFLLALPTTYHSYTRSLAMPIYLRCHIELLLCLDTLPRQSPQQMDLPVAQRQRRTHHPLTYGHKPSHAVIYTRMSLRARSTLTARWRQRWRQRAGCIATLLWHVALPSLQLKNNLLKNRPDAFLCRTLHVIVVMTVNMLVIHVWSLQNELILLTFSSVCNHFTISETFSLKTVIMWAKHTRKFLISKM